MDCKKITELYEAGFSIRKIAYKLGEKSYDIKSYIRNNNITIIKDQFSHDKIDHIVQAYVDGVSAKNLGFKYNIDKRRVLKWAKNINQLRTVSESLRVVFFNENIFDKIDEPTKAYWLGFFYADAYNSESTNTFNITLKGDDHGQLTKLAKFIQLPIDKIKQYTFSQNNKEYSACSLRMYSKHICTKLKELGCPQAKSFIITYPTFLSKELDVHFIRGLFDGDGSLCKTVCNNEWRFKLVSTKECLDSIKTIIYNNTGISSNYKYISKTNNNTYEMVICGNEQVKTVSDWLYGISTNENVLDRKYQKYLELCEQQNNRRFSRQNYKLSNNMKAEISNQISGGDSYVNIAKLHNVHPRTISKIGESDISLICKKFNLPNTQIHNKVIIVNGQAMTSAFFKPLSKDERSKWVDPIITYFKDNKFIYPDNFSKVLRDYNKLVNFSPDTSNDEVFNNSSLATYISKYFCKDFYKTTENNNKILDDVFQDEVMFRKLIENRLVINWNSSVNETFNISFAMLVQGMRSARMIPQISIFKPSIAKYMCEKYSNPGDLVGDYSCGFGARMLGAVSSNRRYIGTDPLTTPDLAIMRDAIGINKDQVTLINSGSEHFQYEPNSLDLCYSSPPYYDQEVYNASITQAYNQGEDYFYNVYWKNTLNNVKIGLKPGKWFGLNITTKYERMISMATSVFGEPIEIVKLKTIRSHLAKSAGDIKFEPIYMYKNVK